jgi:hypothetical protein
MFMAASSDSACTNFLPVIGKYLDASWRISVAGVMGYPK